MHWVQHQLAVPTTACSSEFDVFWENWAVEDDIHSFSTEKRIVTTTELTPQHYLNKTAHPAIRVGPEVFNAQVPWETKKRTMDAGPPPKNELQ